MQHSSEAACGSSVDRYQLADILENLSVPKKRQKAHTHNIIAQTDEAVQRKYAVIFFPYLFIYLFIMKFVLKVQYKNTV